MRVRPTCLRSGSLHQCVDRCTDTPGTRAARRSHGTFTIQGSVCSSEQCRRCAASKQRQTCYCDGAVGVFSRACAMTFRNVADAWHHRLLYWPWPARCSQLKRWPRRQQRYRCRRNRQWAHLRRQVRVSSAPLAQPACLHQSHSMVSLTVPNGQASVVRATSFSISPSTPHQRWRRWSS